MIKYSDNALAIYKRLYFDETKGETKPEEVHERVANFIGDNDNEKQDFLDLMNSKTFRPNTPCLINAGRTSDKTHDTQLAACFTIGLEDSMDSIIEMWSVCAKIYASGAGSGIPITNLRETGSPINSGGKASGSLAYMKVIDLLSDTVRSGGRTRRASNLAAFKYNHPETIQIIESKENNQTLKNFNLSMTVDNIFMDSIINNENINFPVISPNKGEIISEINNIELWNKIIKIAHKCGDPGLLFIDTVNKFNSLPSYGKIDVTNPCGEVPLPPWSVCNLGSLNLNSFISENQIEKFFNWNAFHKAIKTATRFLDNVIDKTSYLHPNFEKMSKANRSIGLGIMGFADVLVKLNILYGSKESIEFFEDICRDLTSKSIKASIELAAEKGPINIPDQDKNHFINLLKHYTSDNLNDFYNCGIRNSNWTCIAPTGSVSLSADCSYAWEPLMALVWEKPLTDSDQVLKIIHPEFEKDLNNWTKKVQLDKENTISDIVKHRGSIQHIGYIPQEMKNKYKVAHDIDPYKKIEMQGVGQKYISMAISSTCNLPNNATTEDISKIYQYAYTCGLKGITIFRDGCLSNQPVNFGKIKEATNLIENDLKQEVNRLVSGLPIKKKTRPIKRMGETVEVQTPYGKLFTTCNFDNNKKPLEIFFRVGKQGALTNVLIDALGRVCSKALQDGSSLEHLADTLRGLKGEKFWFKVDDDMDSTESAESIVDAIAIIMEHHWNWVNEPKKIKIINECEYENCPECHRKSLRHDGGCRGGYCPICGYSQCG